MEYSMGLQEKYFNFMKYGTKKIETRLYDLKRQQLKVGDIIYFYKEPVRKKVIKAKIVNIKIYDNFSELIENNNISDLASSETDKKEYLEDLEQYYPREEQEKNGVCAIEILKLEKSCGMVVFKDDKVLLVHHTTGHWGIPKGHVEENETEEETAIREVLEETGISCSKITDFRRIITYSPRINTMKDVVVFIGKPDNDDIVPQLSEVVEVKYVDINEINNYVTTKDTLAVINEAVESIKTLQK